MIGQRRNGNRALGSFGFLALSASTIGIRAGGGGTAAWSSGLPDRAISGIESSNSIDL